MVFFSFVQKYICWYLSVFLFVCGIFSVRILEFSFVVVVYFDHFKMGKKLFFCFVYLFKNWNFFPLLFFESNKTMMMAVDDKHTLIPNVEIFWRRKICVLDWLIDWLILRFFFKNPNTIYTDQVNQPEKLITMYKRWCSAIANKQQQQKFDPKNHFSKKKLQQKNTVIIIVYHQVTPSCG